jgi:hypothetical protein
MGPEAEGFSRQVNSRDFLKHSGSHIEHLTRIRRGFFRQSKCFSWKNFGLLHFASPLRGIPTRGGAAVSASRWPSSAARRRASG